MLLLLEEVLFVAATVFGWKELVIVATMDFFIVGLSLVADRIKLQMYKRMVSNAGQHDEK